MTDNEIIALLLLYGNVINRVSGWVSFNVPGSANYYRLHPLSAHDIVKGWMEDVVLRIEGEK